MRLLLKQLKKLQVETSSGIMLGRVCDVIFETDGQTILQYEVCKCRWCGQRFLINRSQIVRFEEKKIIVDDSVKKIEAEAVIKPAREAQSNPALMIKD